MRAIKLETARILFSSDVFDAVAVVSAKALSFFFLLKTYWFAWVPFPEEGLYTIGCTSELLVLNSVLKPARVSIEGIVEIGSLSNSVFERRTSTGSGLFASLGSGLVETLG